VGVGLYRMFHDGRGPGPGGVSFVYGGIFVVFHPGGGIYISLPQLAFFLFSSGVNYYKNKLNKISTCGGEKKTTTTLGVCCPGGFFRFFSGERGVGGAGVSSLVDHHDLRRACAGGNFFLARGTLTFTRPPSSDGAPSFRQGGGSHS